MTAKAKYDCQSCGACCYNPPENVSDGLRDYVEVNPRNALLKTNDDAAKYTFVKNGKHWLRMVGRVERCCALAGSLGKSVRCTIYEKRPTVCRLVRPGDMECKLRREQRGLPV